MLLRLYNIKYNCFLLCWQDVREHYERKLVIANDLYLELSAAMLQLEQREKEINR